MHSGTGGFPNYNTFVTTVDPGSSWWIGITDTSDTNLSYGVGAFQPDYTSKCGIINVLQFDNINSNVGEYVNMKVTDGSFVPCP